MMPFLLLSARPLSFPVLLGLALIGTLLPDSRADDVRSYQHGIDILPLPNGRYRMIWSSSGHPPTGSNADGSWPHDVYYADIDPQEPVIKPQKWLSRPEAQEPVSSAITTDGHIMVTMEDGWNADNVLAQRYGVYDAGMNPVQPYPQVVFAGGHSGHIAAAGNRFVVFYSEGWVDGGGVDDLGSGDDVHVAAYRSSGRFANAARVAVGDRTRDWWPLVAGSERHALLLWQRFVDGRTWSLLMARLYDPARGRFVTQELQLADRTEYYTYDVQYLHDVGRFLVIATLESGQGVAFLINDRGRVVARQHNLPAVVREAQPAVRSLSSPNRRAVQVVYPAQQGGVMVLEVSSDKIESSGRLAGPTWHTAGTDGIFLPDQRAWFVNLSPQGLVDYTFSIDDNHQSGP